MFNIFWTLKHMRETFRNVLDNSLASRVLLSGRAKLVGLPDQNAILVDIPKIIESHLIKIGKADLYTVKGSIGNGNLARVPWVGIFRNSITENAENGYYVVLLFSEDMSCCFLSLNQGVTAVEKLYTKKFAWKKMREVAAEAYQLIEVDPDAIVGKIDLHATLDLGKGYQAGAIESFRYPYDNLPTIHDFLENLDHLLLSYNRLEQLFGRDLYSLFKITEEEFQEVSLQKAAAIVSNDEEKKLEDIGGEPIIDSAKLGSKGIVRSPAVAAKALRSANFLCEIDSKHWTFTSRSMQQKYVEAHHLIPICHQNKFIYSLDVVANVISLCATCHRMLHFGVPKEKTAVLKLLLKRRSLHLSKKSISITEKDFLDFYRITGMLD